MRLALNILAALGVLGLFFWEMKRQHWSSGAILVGLGLLLVLGAASYAIHRLWPKNGEPPAA